MVKASSRKIAIRRFTGRELADADDWIAVEEPLEIRIGFDDDGAPGESLVVTMRTPGHDEELAMGLLFTEGLVDKSADVLGFVVTDPSEGGSNVLDVTVRSVLRGRFEFVRRRFYASSACGVCGKPSLDALRGRDAPAVGAGEWRIDTAALMGLPAALAARQPHFAATGGLHAAGLFDAGGALGEVREDVGRHNAMDKLIGAALRDGRLPLSARGIVVSGRASFEIVDKARSAGCPLLAAVGAPSSRAIETAWEAGITLVGFLRDGRFNIYATPWRVAPGPGAAG